MLGNPPRARPLARLPDFLRPSKHSPANRENLLPRIKDQSAVVQKAFQKSITGLQGRVTDIVKVMSSVSVGNYQDVFWFPGFGD